MDKNFKYFSIKVLLFALPIIVLIVLAISADPFKVFKNYSEYYKDNFITGNREYVCLKLYEQNSKIIKYNSFIFGSSRSQAFKVKKWESFLPLNARGFHFDGSSEGIYGIYNKIRFIDESRGQLDNVLMIVDQDTLSTTKNRKGFLFISPPKLSNESPAEFYISFIEPLLNLKFVVGYIDYSIFKTYRKYMSNLFLNATYDNYSDNLTGDLYYGYDKMILENKEAYYKKLVDEGVFYNRTSSANKIMNATNDEKKLLGKIKSIFDKHGTSYRVVISPAYDQIPLGSDHLQLLKDIFGAETVYNYSGVNNYTESIYNYYEDSHFRPHVADDIMLKVYASTSKIK